MGKKEFDEKGAIADLMLIMTNPLWGTGMVVVIDSGFFVLEGLILMVDKGVLGSELIKKRRYWPNEMTVEEIILHIQHKEVGYVNAVQVSIIGKRYHIMSIE